MRWLIGKPRVAQVKSAAAADAATRTVGALKQADAPAASNGTVMIVASESDPYQSLEQTLRTAGYAVAVVRSVPQALESLAATTPSLIVICCTLPAETCRALRRVTEAPILVLLTAAREEDVVKSLEAGADDCQYAATGTREVLLRMRALQRRHAWEYAPAAAQPHAHPCW